MAASIFDIVADELERRTEFAKLEARGTLRMALKEGGLNARNVRGEQMSLILLEVMPKELCARGIENADEICDGIDTVLKSQHPAYFRIPKADSPEAVFRRSAKF